MSHRSKTVRVSRRRCRVCGTPWYAILGKREECPFKACHPKRDQGGKP